MAERIIIPTPNPTRKKRFLSSPSSLSDLSLPHNEDLIGSDDGRQPTTGRDVNRILLCFLNTPVSGNYPLPVGHYNGGSVGTHCGQRGLNVALCLRVQGGRGLEEIDITINTQQLQHQSELKDVFWAYLIQQDDLGRFEDGASDGHPLLLSSAQLQTPLAYLCAVS